MGKELIPDYSWGLQNHCPSLPPPTLSSLLTRIHFVLELQPPSSTCKIYFYTFVPMLIHTVSTVSSLMENIFSFCCFVVYYRLAGPWAFYSPVSDSHFAIGADRALVLQMYVVQLWAHQYVTQAYRAHIYIFTKTNMLHMLVTKNDLVYNKPWCHLSGFIGNRCS